MERKEMFIHHPQLGHQNLARGGFLNWKDIARQNKSNTNKCQTHSLQCIFFSLINIVTCGSWGRFAVRLPGGGGGGVRPGNPPVLLLHAWHNITMFSMPGEHHQDLSTESKGAAMGTSSSSLGLRRRALQERAPAEQKKFSPRQNAFPISPPLPWVDVKLFAKLEVSPMENSERIQRMKQLHSLKVTGVEFDGR